VPTIEQAPFKQLADDLSGRVSTAHDADWDSARQGFNLAVDLRPAAVVHPVDVRDVIAVVAFAREHELRVSPFGPGHNMSPLADADMERTIMLRTTEMAGVEIDAAAQRARVRAGTPWGPVVDAAAEHGLASLHGTAPSVGVTGYTLGGGIGWYARKRGLAANSVTAIELVTADGREVRADHDNEPELFWALRGGGGNFGVVTALELDLFPIEQVYAGMFLFGWERATEVLGAWNSILPELPDELTSLARILQVPDLETIPEIVRGGKFVAVEATYMGGEEEGAKLLEPIRSLGPDVDTYGMVPPPALAFLHMDPPEPVPAVGGGGLYDELPQSAIEGLVEAAGPDSGSQLVSVELRHTAGALARSGPDHGALATLDGSMLMYSVGMAPDAGAAAALTAQVDRVKASLRPHDVGVTSNFMGSAFDKADAFPDDTVRRLGRVREELDPERLFQPNHEV
jgi:FAD/FMN-containing dehydrogenase